MAAWDATRVKTQLRLTAQKLGLLQDKLEAQAQITRRDIAILLQQGNVSIARAKAQKLMREDILSDLYQSMEMHVGVILGHLGEFDRSYTTSPIVVESASTIVFAAPHLECKELQVVRENLISRLGPDFARSAVGNKDKYVQARVVQALSAHPPSAASLDRYLFNVAKTQGIQWQPDLQPDDTINAISEMLDLSADPSIDTSRLRTLCTHGLPEHPPWLRPKVWRILLGTLPADKPAWNAEAQKQRDNYYDLVRRLLEPFSSLPPPTTPLATMDASLMDVSKELAQVPLKLLSGLSEEPEATPLCPLDDTAADDIKIPCAHNLNDRLRAIHEHESQGSEDPHSTPEIRLDTPEIRLEDAEDDSSDDSGEAGDADGLKASNSASALSNSHSSTTLLASRAYGIGGLHQRHSSALLRLLYIHYCLNPANRSPQIASLLVPLYSVLNEEVSPEDVVHIEADTFWLFEAMIGEFSELEDIESGNLWVRKFGDRLHWADPDFAEDLQAKGLDPALPHYSYRWLTPLLTHTLPLPSVIMVWDALFSRPMRGRDTNPKLDYLLDVCTSMLLCARGRLVRLGKPGLMPLNTWANESADLSASILDEHDLEDAFAEGMAFLQYYPISEVGGIELVLQTAHDLYNRREAGGPASRPGPSGLSTRLRETMRGFAFPAVTLESHEEEDEETDGSDYIEDLQEASANSNGINASALTARLADTVWRGITNQSAMDAPPSPAASSFTPSPVSNPRSLPEEQPRPEAPPSNDTSNGTPRKTAARASIWGYAEKLKESDAAATLAKVSTNWRVKALDVWHQRTGSGGSTSSLFGGGNSSPGSDARRFSAEQERRYSSGANDSRRGSVSESDQSGAYSPPARPAFFRPVRDSIMPAARGSPVASPLSDTGSISRHGARGSLPSLSISDSAKTTSKQGPRPLLLGSISGKASPLMRSPTGNARSPTGYASPSTVTDRQWADTVRATRPSNFHRGSQSSISSLSPSDPMMRSRRETRSDWESDTTSSRVVPLNRNSRSPMAKASRRAASITSMSSAPSETVPPLPPMPATETDAGTISRPASRGWGRVDMPDSPPPLTPDAGSTTNTGIKVKGPESQAQRGSVVLSEPSDSAPEVHAEEHKLQRRTATISRRRTGVEENSDSSSTQDLPRTPRTKAKRVPPRLANLRTNSKGSTAEPPLPKQNSLAPEWPDEHDTASTPRAQDFDTAIATSPSSPNGSRRLRKTSGDTISEPRSRKLSTEGREVRTRKISSESVRSRKVSSERGAHKRESAAVEGDDEGYGELLSAYESEDNAI